MTIEVVVKENTGKRLDAYATELLGDCTRSFVKNLIERGCIRVNGAEAKAGAKLKLGDMLCICVPDAEPVALVPQNIPLDIIYQDADLAVINKPQGMVIHPAAGNPDGTLVNALLYHIKDLSGINGELRPGIVHRLDKDTSGLIVIAKNDVTHVALTEQIAARNVVKVYTALCYGNIKADQGTVRTLIGRDLRDRKKMAVTRNGREAITHYQVLRRYGAYTLLEATIETGRTHQIRVHMKHLGHPVVGDAVYSRNKAPFALQGQLLHATRLGFTHPGTGEYVEFIAPLPPAFEQILDSISEMQK